MKRYAEPVFVFIWVALVIIAIRLAHPCPAPAGQHLESRNSPPLVVHTVH